MSIHTPTEFDIIGVGFGPSNLALATAVTEHNQHHPEAPIRAHFVEKREFFDWHPGMMLPDAQMQISWLKDLATFRNPQSPFTFINYLFDSGRLVDFVNMKTFFPSRLEFRDYLRWAADRVDSTISYGREVRSIGLDSTRATVHLGPDAHAVNEPETLHAPVVVFAPGLRPVLPEGIVEGPRVFHNIHILDRLEGIDPQGIREVVVIGSGQSAAEVLLYFHATMPHAHVHGVFGRYGISPSDDTPFANRVFDPAAVDDWFAADPKERERQMAYHRQTNYSAVDAELIEELFRLEYGEKVTGNTRLHLHRTTRLEHCAEDSHGVTVRLRNAMTGEETTMQPDLVVFATGFEETPIADFIDPASASVITTDHVSVGRDYRLPTTTNVGVYLNGGVERTHGLSSSLLSNVAIRAADILNSIIEHRAGHHSTHPDEPAVSP
ncbi:lysine N(6)-hydroxylase/L-ornithine N(5)-oxygenase family protein [Corynebacterium canis]|uniref:L-lysine N6-monooxygenase MbtG n=1 Tax=Corynebacterium canis TaxID=679663 RepID=A0A5C5UDR5_9CORY|nr:SidA/IucD/PvdA family monooxygenase [Corynebacterium canis]TWT24186.1 lysine N(6)-hydroxylase/L-ornithine N(5)-oxygenase family protein [Corynebacterium canis]WJY74422.1 L-ornithine 5-monooxygenase [Corynebacterium canis]